MNQHPLKFFQNQNLKTRPLQEQVLNQVFDNWNKYKYIALNLPTGVGKSYIATSIASSIENAYLLTSSIQLQQQYESSWSELVNLKGRNNYQCAINNLYTVDAAPCMASDALLKDCLSNNICHYYNQKNKALESQSMITNPLYFLYSTHCGFGSDVEESRWKVRSALIIDEAHSLEDKLVQFGECIIDPKKIGDEYGVDCYSMLFSNDFVSNYEKLEKLKLLISERCDYFKSKIEQEFPESLNKNTKSWAKSFTTKMAEKVKKLNGKLYSLDKFLQSLHIFFDTHASIEELNNRWIISVNEDNSQITLSPLYANFLFTGYMTKMADKFVFLSATLGSKSEFCKELGIPESECLYIETNTPFPAVLSPVVSLPLIKTGYKDIQNSMKDIVASVDTLLENHSEESGIIHSVNYKISKELVEKCKYKNRFIHRDMYDGQKLKNEKLLELHESGKIPNSVLLSPSMMEGVDLSGDLSTFQIIIKFPWGSLGDPRIKKKSEVDPRWYSNKVWLNIMQACGRSTRHELDNSTTYILDSSFKHWFQLWKHNLPLWFRERVIF